MKVDHYRQQLATLGEDEWEPFLLKESGLPGRRSSLELAQAAAEEGDRRSFEAWPIHGPRRAPTDSPGEFLAFCGVPGLGRLLAQGATQHFETLRRCASDPRWRIREPVAMALQRFGEARMDALLREMETWSKGGLLEQRAVVAGLCEPGLLAEADHVRVVLRLLEAVTTSIEAVKERRSPEFLALRKGLGYCWSVAVVALP